MQIRKNALKTLIDDYKKIRADTDIKNISEQTIRSWIDDFLKIFGWDTKDTSSIIQEKQLSLIEKDKLIRINSTSNRPDYKFILNGNVKTFLDTKNVDVNLKECKKSAFQIKSYGWSISAPCSFITNFDEFVIYDTSYQPSREQEVTFGRIYLSIDEYLDNFEILDNHLHKEKISSGILERLYSDNLVNLTKIPTDVAFANNLSKFRLNLGNAIISNNSKIINNNIELLSYIVQMTINRIVFIRICEARNIEKDGLLLEFKEKGFWESFKHSSYYDFFEHYDGPLFARDIRLQKLIIPDEVFEELLYLFYYPSPYKFDVIPTTLFSNIYEIFLAKRLEFKDGILIEEIKPEYSKTNGVVSTPQFLVKDLIKRTIIKSEILKYNLNEIWDLKVLDFACGSGAFIVELFDYLQSILIEKYLIDDDNEKYKEYFHTKNEHTVMTIEGKRRLISGCIHGIDIDAEAVEVARMSLALKIIDDLLDYEDYSNLGVYGHQILNKIGHNIEYGNTLVSEDIIELCPEIKEQTNEKQYSSLNIFNWWKDGFEDIFSSKKGFDYIIGNPPYVEAKHMTNYTSIMHNYLKKRYSSANKGKIDLLIPFIERGIDLLNSNGKMGLIIQNRFFKNEYGEGIRQLISSRRLLSEVITFDVNNIFRDRITYISHLILDKKSTDKIFYSTIKENIYSLPSFLQKLPSSKDDETMYSSVNSSNINKEPWIFENPELLAMKDTLSVHNVPFGKFAEIRVGIQVLWVKAYHLKVLSIDNEKKLIRAKSGLDDNIIIEIDACRSLVPNEKFYSFRKEVNDTYAIFPYDIYNGKKNPILFDDFCNRFPLAGEYLTKHKKTIQDNIKDNKYNPNDSQKWHLYTRESHLERNYPKVLIPMTANDVYASVTLNDFYYCDNSNVNYTDIPNKSKENLYAVASIFNSTIFSVLARAIANKQQNGYYKLNKQYIEPVLFPAYIFENNHPFVKELASVGINIEEKQNEYIYSPPLKQKKIKQELSNLWDKLDSLTAQAYKLTKEQEEYFNRLGRNINRNDILDNIL
ncbi:type II deoxyribonuclease [Aliarcobacter trophiarum LMG 25534]|uniref:site-specific DNA-methyltransferase (adenine-specific) n=1 Tax=Aliarcobacter trophiarum LMG 25534 TaxID=1032241 RepID=A0AAD0QIE6_9BACT|nr:N-6 DNA methylase [Aliarcobacter trophiarum]AXK48462.1 type IIG restriction/modification system [Aliarcobacter trophiarum LMG 25534]RXJ90007.1 type II deoxyribonuclease [Aliarcobacter trophiarum LMG 25534]